MKSYGAHIRDIRSALPTSVRRLTGMYFHDCELRRLEFVERNTVILWLHGYKHYYTRARPVRGLHQLTFKGVTETDLALRHLGAYWGYEEIDWTGQHAQLRVLLRDQFRSPQFHILFRALDLQTEDTEHRPARRTH